mgnify:CR=1 FL=1
MPCFTDGEVNRRVENYGCSASSKADHLFGQFVTVTHCAVSTSSCCWTVWLRFAKAASI